MPPGGGYVVAGIAGAIVSLIAVDLINVDDPWKSIIPVVVLVLGLLLAGWRFSKGG